MKEILFTAAAGLSIFICLTDPSVYSFIAGLGTFLFLTILIELNTI